MIAPKDIKAVKNSFETQIILYGSMFTAKNNSYAKMNWMNISRNDRLFSTLLICDIFHTQWAVSS